MKLLIMHFFTLLSYIRYRPKFSPQHHVLKRSWSMYLPRYQRPSFTPIQNHRQEHCFVYSNF
jgi:hypothetical protein